jgi:hypothetical protein
MAHVRMCHHAASAAAIAFPHAWQRVPVRKYRTDLKADMGRAKRKRLQWVELYRLPRDRSRRQIQPVDAAPGIGETLATTIMLETGSIARFPSVRQFSSYYRCVESKRISNGKKKGEGNAKNGNKYLSVAFIEVAAVAMRSCPHPPMTGVNLLLYYTDCESSIPIANGYSPGFISTRRYSCPAPLPRNAMTGCCSAPHSNRRVASRPTIEPTMQRLSGRPTARTSRSGIRLGIRAWEVPGIVTSSARDYGDLDFFIPRLKRSARQPDNFPPAVFPSCVQRVDKSAFRLIPQSCLGPFHRTGIPSRAACSR